MRANVVLFGVGRCGYNTGFQHITCLIAVVGERDFLQGWQDAPTNGGGS